PGRLGAGDQPARGGGPGAEQLPARESRRRASSNQSSFRPPRADAITFFASVRDPCRGGGFRGAGRAVRQFYRSDDQALTGGRGAKMRIIHVGLGGRGRAWIEVCRRHPEVEVAGFVEPDNANMKLAQEKFGLSPEILFGVMDAAVGSVEADAVLD